MGLEERMSNPSYRNWLRVGLGLLEMKKALQLVTDKEINKFYESLISKYSLNQKQSCPNPGCKASNFDKKTRLFKASCPNGICDKLLNDILEQHSQKKNPALIYISNCECQKWVSHRWEIAKFYMGSLGAGKIKVTGSPKTDVAGLLILMKHCLLFRPYSDANKIDKQLIIRNNLCHSPTFTIEEAEDVKNPIEDMIGFLQHLTAKQEALNLGASKKTNFEETIIALRQLLADDLVLSEANRSKVENCELEFLLKRMSDWENRMEDSEASISKLQNTARVTMEFVREHADLMKNTKVMDCIKDLDCRLSLVELRVDNAENGVQANRASIETLEERVFVVDKKVTTFIDERTTTTLTVVKVPPVDPKNILYQWTIKYRHPPPTYDWVQQKSGLYTSTVTVAGKTFQSDRDHTKRIEAEKNAADIAYEILFMKSLEPTNGTTATDSTSQLANNEPVRYFKQLKDLCERDDLESPLITIKPDKVEPKQMIAVLKMSYWFKSMTLFSKKADADDDAARIALFILNDDLPTNSDKNWRMLIKEYVEKHGCIPVKYAQDTVDTKFRSRVKVQFSHESREKFDTSDNPMINDTVAKEVLGLLDESVPCEAAAAK